jgi:methyltransferase
VRACLARESLFQNCAILCVKMTWAHGLVGLVILQRLGELVHASRNERALRARGGIETGHGHYPVMVVLHATWLTAIAVGLGTDPRIRPLPLAVFVLLQVLRVWVLTTLGPYWTTRVISVPGEPLVRRGPYRFVRHPNYLVVIGEFAVFPLVFGQFRTAVIFSILNLALLTWRIRIENATLRARRHVNEKTKTRTG